MGFLFPLSCLLLLAFRSAQTARLVTRVPKLIKTQRPVQARADKPGSQTSSPLVTPGPQLPAPPRPQLSGFRRCLPSPPHPPTPDRCPRPGAAIAQSGRWAPYLRDTRRAGSRLVAARAAPSRPAASRSTRDSAAGSPRSPLQVRLLPVRGGLRSGGGAKAARREREAGWATGVRTPQRASGLIWARPLATPPAQLSRLRSAHPQILHLRPAPPGPASAPGPWEHHLLTPYPGSAPTSPAAQFFLPCWARCPGRRDIAW